MSTGPKGEKRPADVIANAVLSMKVATGEVEERYVNLGQRAGGRKGGKARAEALNAERRQEVAKEGAKARWSQRRESASRYLNTKSEQPRKDAPDPEHLAARHKPSK